MKNRILVTGGAGFIGSEFVRQAVAKNCQVAVVDKLTYAGDLQRLKEAEGKYSFYKADICDQFDIKTIIAKEKPGVVINFAAESHVDRSIQDATAFVDTNIRGVQVLMDTCRKNKIKRFIQVSTDEVYGEISKGAFIEESPLAPNSPYAASKAAADLMIRSYIRTHNLPAIIVRPSNNYGPWQYPEKLIPLAITKLLRGEKIPLYGKGLNVREWLFVSDCANGIMTVAEKGKLGAIYNLGSGNEHKNKEVISLLLEKMNMPDKLIAFVKDRAGHDFRYRLNSQRIRKELQWTHQINLPQGLRVVVEWCNDHKDWLFSKWNDVVVLYSQA